MYVTLKDWVSNTNNTRFVLMSYPYKDIDNTWDLDLSSRCLIRYLN